MDNNEENNNVMYNLIQTLKRANFLQNNLLYYYFKFDINIIDKSEKDFNFLKSKFPVIVDEYSIFDEQKFQENKISLPYSIIEKPITDYKCIIDNNVRIIKKIYIYDSSNYINSFEFSKGSEVLITFFSDWIKLEKQQNLFHCFNFFQNSLTQSEFFIHSFIYWDLVDKRTDKNSKIINKTKVAKNLTLVTKEPCFSLIYQILKNLYDKYSLNEKKNKINRF